MSKERPEIMTQDPICLLTSIEKGCFEFMRKLHYGLLPKPKFDEVDWEKSCERKSKKEKEKVKKSVKKGHKIQNGPPSGTKQSIWRGYTTGRERGDVSLETKTDPKRRLRSSKNDEKARRISRILLFSGSGFSDRLWQNDRFCCMICTSF